MTMLNVWARGVEVSATQMPIGTHWTLNVGDASLQWITSAAHAHDGSLSKLANEAVVEQVGVERGTAKNWINGKTLTLTAVTGGSPTVEDTGAILDFWRRDRVGAPKEHAQLFCTRVFTFANRDGEPAVRVTDAGREWPSQSPGKVFLVKKADGTCVAAFVEKGKGRHRLRSWFISSGSLKADDAVKVTRFKLGEEARSTTDQVWTWVSGDDGFGWSKGSRFLFAPARKRGRAMRYPNPEPKDDPYELG